MGENKCINSLHYELKKGNGKDPTDSLLESSTFFEKQSMVNLLSFQQSVAKEYILNTEFLVTSKCIQVKLATVNICFAN